MSSQSQGPVSAKILKIISPHLSNRMSASNLEDLAAAACVAWNMSVFETRGIQLMSSLASVPKALEVYIGSFKDRKIDLYPDDTRLVLNLDLRISGGKPDLFIASVPVEVCFLPDGTVHPEVPEGNILKWKVF